MLREAVENFVDQAVPGDRDNRSILERKIFCNFICVSTMRGIYEDIIGKDDVRADETKAVYLRVIFNSQ